MSAIELKSNIHNLVDKIQNEQLLRAVFSLLKASENSKSGRLWETLTEEQKQELLLAYEESEDESNLLDRDQVFGSK